MREFRTRWARQQAAQQAAEARSDGLTPEQHTALSAEFDRRVATFQQKWRGCRDGRCRRGRQCLGSPRGCNLVMLRWTNRHHRRLRRDIVRKPPRV